MKTLFFKTALLILTGCLIFVMTSCDVGTTFDGNKVTDGKMFKMDYSVLDKTEDAYLRLDRGDTLNVAISHTSGAVDVTVKADGDDPIYEGRSLENISFTLGIHSSGRYRITVVGHKACGSVSFSAVGDV